MNTILANYKEQGDHPWFIGEILGKRLFKIAVPKYCLTIRNDSTQVQNVFVDRIMLYHAPFAAAAVRIYLTNKKYKDVQATDFLLPEHWDFIYKAVWNAYKDNPQAVYHPDYKTRLINCIDCLRSRTVKEDI